MDARERVQQVLSGSGPPVDVDKEISDRVHKLVDEVLGAIDHSVAVAGCSDQLKLALGMGALVSCVASYAHCGGMDRAVVLQSIGAAIDGIKAQNPASQVTACPRSEG